MIGKSVIHKKFNKGEVVEFDGSHISVRFPSETAIKIFQYPESFETFLRFEDQDLQQEVESVLKEKKIKAEEAKKRLDEERKQKAINSPLSVNKTAKKTHKVPERKNLAFKLNFCDGDASEDSFGFKNVCSDEMIKYNIEVAKRSWCTYEACPCKKYYDGEITREELEAYRDRREFTCYESIALSDWIAQAGTDLRGINSGKARRLPNVQLGSLAMLTTRLPGTEEKDRAIIGVFIIDTTSEGDDNNEGTVSAKSKYKIEIRPDESENIKFWNYYKNPSNPDSISWGMGLYRFFKDEDAIRLLEDIVKVKEGKEDYSIAVDILEYFKELHK